MSEKLIEVCKGLSVQEIADAVMASRHGATVNDPMALAAYLKLQAG